MRTLKASFYFIAAFVLGLVSQYANAEYVQTNLVSNVPNQAILTDPSLIDPWGISFSPTSPAWIANAGAGVATLYTAANNSLSKLGLTVTIPGAPTGTVFAGVASAFNGNAFLFSSLDGGIFGWRGALGTTAETLVLPSASAVYNGLAIANFNNNTYAYAPNFRSGTIDVFKGSAGAPDLPGHFTDPNLPAGYAPFNVQNLGGKLYVTFAQQDATKSMPVPGAGLGILDVFNVDGTLIQRLVSNSMNGPLNAPFGLAIAPANFGSLSGDLLVGNNGDGKINAFDLSGNFVGTLTDTQGIPITNALLLALAFGNGTSFASNALLFTAGDGLFGEIQAVPIPAALPLFATGLGVLGLLGWRRKRKAAVGS
jgi:uncharacterized protein (TIGR03118 family)